jgi:hypothetical protein
MWYLEASMELLRQKLFDQFKEPTGKMLQALEHLVVLEKLW